MFKTNPNKTTIVIPGDNMSLRNETLKTVKRLFGNAAEEGYFGIATNGKDCQAIAMVEISATTNDANTLINGREALSNYALRIKAIYNLENVILVSGRLVDIL